MVEEGARGLISPGEDNQREAFRATGPRGSLVPYSALVPKPKSTIIFICLFCQISYVHLCINSQLKPKNMNFKLNHEKSDLGESLGIEKERSDELVATVLFELTNNQFNVASLYDDPEEAPRSLTTKSGMIERIASHVDLLPELVFILIEYAKYDTLSSVDNEMSERFVMSNSMLYMQANKDKQKFIELFKRIKKR